MSEGIREVCSHRCCTVCSESKPLTEFYHRYHQCRSCKSAKDKMRVRHTYKAASNTTAAARARKRRWAPKTDKAKARARSLLRGAVARGDIIRPEECEECGTVSVRSDGRTSIQGHHEDYARPLDVRWLCPLCHKKAHVSDAARAARPEGGA